MNWWTEAVMHQVIRSLPCLLPVTLLTSWVLVLVLVLVPVPVIVVLLVMVMMVVVVVVAVMGMVVQPSATAMQGVQGSWLLPLGHHMNNPNSTRHSRLKCTSLHTTTTRTRTSLSRALMMSHIMIVMMTANIIMCRLTSGLMVTIAVHRWIAMLVPTPAIMLLMPQGLALHHTHHHQHHHQMYHTTQHLPPLP